VYVPAGNTLPGTSNGWLNVSTVRRLGLSFCAKADGATAAPIIATARNVKKVALVVMHAS
jgi:hypothetical protein